MTEQQLPQAPREVETLLDPGLEMDEGTRNIILRIIEKEIPNWKNLSVSQIQSRLDALIEDSQKTISRSENQIDGFKFLLLGLALGVVGNLWASLFYDLLKDRLFIYIPVLFFITCGALVWTMDLFIKRIDTQMSNSPFTRPFWEKEKEG